MRGAGTSDNLGLTIDNIKIVKEGTTENLVINGDFEHPKVDRNSKVFSGGIQRWMASDIEIGVGLFFNPRWTTQVCDLDGNGNSIMTKVAFHHSIYLESQKKPCSIDNSEDFY